MSGNVFVIPSISYLKINNGNTPAFLDCSYNITSTHQKLVNNKKGLFRKKNREMWE